MMIPMCFPIENLERIIGLMNLGSIIMIVVEGLFLSECITLHLIMLISFSTRVFRCIFQVEFWCPHYYYKPVSIPNY